MGNQVVEPFVIAVSAQMAALAQAVDTGQGEVSAQIADTGQGAVSAQIVETVRVEEIAPDEEFNQIPINVVTPIPEPVITAGPVSGKTKSHSV